MSRFPKTEKRSADWYDPGCIEPVRSDNRVDPKRVRHGLGLRIKNLPFVTAGPPSSTTSGREKC